MLCYVAVTGVEALLGYDDALEPWTAVSIGFLKHFSMPRLKCIRDGGGLKKRDVMRRRKAISWLNFRKKKFF